MSHRRIASIQDVTAGQLCSGCGACASVQPDEISMVDDLLQGRRPIVAPESDTTTAFAACPGAGLAHPDGLGERGDLVLELLDEWGPVIELWEGHAGDPDIRFHGSSGGLGTALALHCLELEGMSGVLHIAARDDVPYLNRTVLSSTRDELLDATGSRYAPASPCDALDLATTAPRPVVFIGKPCDVGAIAKLRDVAPRLVDNIGLTIAIFCAGTPSTAGTLEMLERMGIADPSTVRSVRYRGNGWPGRATAVAEDGGSEITRYLSYEESWGRILQRHRPWRCHVCADHTGEFADIAVGDPWYREVSDEEPGLSLVLARTERGRRLLSAARESGAADVRRVSPRVLAESQPNLLRTRGALWGRTLTSRAMGAGAPRYRNMPTFPAWRRHLTWREKAQSFYGTIKRVFTRRLRQDATVEGWSPP